MFDRRCCLLSHRVCQLDASYSFDRYCAEFNKRYTGDEYVMRSSVFQKNLAHILDHNAKGLSWKVRGRAVLRYE